MKIARRQIYHARGDIVKGFALYRVSLCMRSVYWAVDPKVVNCRLCLKTLAKKKVR